VRALTEQEAAEEYPDTVGVRQYTLSSNFFVADDFGPCWDCGEETCFIEINFETWLHPGTCEANKDREYWEAVRTGNERHGTDHERFWS
jgi:hypothetical protein